MTDLLDLKLLVVTGKGGTGKTTVACALAKLAAQSGKRVLLCEIDATGDIGAPFGVDKVEFEPAEVEPNLFIMAMDTEKALHEYLKLNLKLPFPMRMGSVAKMLDFVAAAAPGVREILTMGKVCWDVKRETYDLVVVDAASTGHIISQLESPDSIGELVTVGPLVHQTQWMREMLRDPQRTGAIVVATPEEMPVNESIELVHRLRDVTHTSIGAVVVNRVLPELYVRSDQALFDDVVENRREEFNNAVGSNGVALLEAAQLATSLRRSQVRYLDVLTGALQPGLPVLFIPQVFSSDEAVSVTNEAVVSLGAELDQ